MELARSRTGPGYGFCLHLAQLFFGGGGMTEETCERLLENVEFMTTDSDAAKGVSVRMKNSVDEVEKFSQLLL